MAGLEVESLTPLHEPESGREDWLFEIAVTPNRGDCLGLMGLAREVAVLSGTSTTPISVTPHGKASLSKRVSVAIEDPALCARYSARIADEVRVGPAPALMRFRLEACGIRSINNVVDITNYVMLETGQPLHAFDLERLPARAINVRPAREIKKFTTLDGVERELISEDLLICDGDVPVALAGVMGGADSEVRSETRSVLLESANFDPVTIRRTARRLGLHSEASHRFERAVDPNGTLAALDRAVQLLETHAQAPADGVVDRYPGKRRPAELILREDRIERLLGVAVDAKKSEGLLRGLGLKAERQAKKKAIKVTLSSERPDLRREADLIEEIARLQGYDQLPTTMPRLRALGAANDVRLGWERRLRCLLTGAGLVEVINLPFVAPEINQLFPGLWRETSNPVAVLNPLVKESAEMRLSLLPGLLENLKTNLAQRAASFHAFHLGKVFRQWISGNEERSALATLLYGPRARRGLRDGALSALDFFEVKGMVESIMDLLHIDAAVAWNAAAQSAVHPGKAASLSIAGESLGYLGQIHPDVCDRFDLPPFFVFELDFEGLLQYAPRQITARTLAAFSFGRTRLCRSWSIAIFPRNGSLAGSRIRAKR